MKKYYYYFPYYDIPLQYSLFDYPWKPYYSALDFWVYYVNHLLYECLKTTSFPLKIIIIIIFQEDFGKFLIFFHAIITPSPQKSYQRTHRFNEDN